MESVSEPFGSAPAPVADLPPAAVAKVSDLKNGEMREVTLGEGKVLLVKENNEFKAIGNKCTHYGAPLKDGVLCNGRVRCPWHGACFSTTTGDIEDSPGIDSIHTFKVRVEDDNVIVRANPEDLKVWKRPPNLTSCSAEDKRLFVILGGGAAGQTAAETLRAEGFQGRIVVVTKESELPYDRPKLSKAMTIKIDQILLRNEAFYKNNNIDFIFGDEALELDAERRIVKLKGGQELNYDAVLIATGGDPRTLPVPGKDLANIYALRVLSEAHAIAANSEGKNIVIVGSSFIGMEVASCLAGKAQSLSVIGMEKVPFERVLGAEVGAAIQKLHEAKGVRFYLQRVVKEFKGEGVVRQVVLDDGTELDADLVVIGAGIIPATNFVKPDGRISIGRDRSIQVDQYLKATDGVYAAGDVARFPYVHAGGESIRVEHWGLAQKQGKVAARNMVGRVTPLTSVPFFWTVQFGKSIRYAGHAVTYDNVLVQGSADDMKFVAYYSLNGKVLAVASVGMDPVASAAAELLALDKMPSLAELQRGPVDFKALL